ncbi:MAG: acyltransferase family protein [Wujia sp.]
MMNITLCVYMCMLLAVLLPGMKIAKKGQFQEQPFDCRITKGMQGFFALGILIHHVSLVLRFFDGYDRSLFFFEDLGTLFVGFFFLCSGYGLIVSYEQKENYLDSFVIKRVLMVLVPFFICNYIYMFTTQIFGQKFSMKELVEAFFGILLLNDHMWFVIEIMILYLLFYFVFRYVKKDGIRFTLIAVVTLLMMVGSFLAGHDDTLYQQANWFRGEWWYNTTLLFLVGMVFGKKREAIYGFARKHYKWLVVVVTIAFVAFYKLTMYMLATRGYWKETETDMAYADKAVTFSVQVVMVLLFEIWMVLILMKVRFDNRVLRFLGRVSLEMILLEKTFILVYREMGYNTSSHLYMFLILASTMVGAMLINKIKMIVLERK